MNALALPLSLLLASAARADVLTVDDSGGKQFTDIQPAIDAALDGDVVLVWHGQYGDVEIDGKAVQVIARGLPATVSSILVRNLSAGQSVVLKGFLVSGSPDTAPVRLLDNAAPIWLEWVRSNLTGSGFTMPCVARVRNCADVVLSWCGFNALEVTGLGDGPAGLWATNSRVTLYDTSTWAGAGGTGAPASEAGDGGAAIRAWSCDLFLGGGHCTGGDGGSSSDTACGPGAGGSALWLEGAGNVVHTVEADLIPGVAGPPVDCPPAADGSPVQDDGQGTQFTAWAGTIPSLTNTAFSEIEGGVKTFQVSSMPLDHQLFVVFGAAPGTWLLPALSGRVVVDPVAVVHPVGPVSAFTPWTVQLPRLPPGVGSKLFFLQPIEVDPSSGAAILGTPIALHVIDQDYL